MNPPALEPSLRRAASADGVHRSGRWVFGEARAMWVGCIAVLLLMWLAIAAIGAERALMVRHERAELAASTAKGFSEYVGLHLLIADRMLVNSRDSFARLGAIPPHQVLTAEFGQMAPMLLQVAIADARGNMVASSLPLAPGLSIADRPHFLAFRDDPRDRLYVSQPVVGRVSKRMSLQLVRPLLGPDGRFAGVIVASIDPLRLQEYFGSLSGFATGGTVLIAGRQDGLVRARFTDESITWGQSLLASPQWKRLSGETSGSFEAVSVIDGRRRTSGFHRVADYPLVVAVSSTSAGWSWRDMGLSIALGLCFSVVLVRHTAVRVRRQREQETVIARLEESRRREMEANRMKSNFIASVSHELRTPLNSILGFSEVIRDVPDDPGNGRYAALIHASGTHLHALLNTLLDLAKIEAGRMELDLAEVDLVDTLRTLVEVHRGSAGRKGLALTMRMDLPGGQTVVADTDRTKLVQVFNNVLSNAVKFTARGEIHVDLGWKDGTFSARVRDTGCGIAAGKLPHVFERFSSVAVVAAGDDAGSGLGLSLSRDLLQLLGGAIRIASEPGAGTEVTIELPGARLAPPP